MVAKKKKATDPETMWKALSKADKQQLIMRHSLRVATGNWWIQYVAARVKARGPDGDPSL